MRLTTCLFRAWYRYCVVGQAKEDRHERVAEDPDQQGIPKVSVDSGILGEVVPATAAQPRPEQSQATAYLCVVDHVTFAMTAIKTTKQVTDYFIKVITSAIANGGYSYIILFSDGEPACEAIQAAVCKARAPHGTVCRNAPPLSPEQRYRRARHW